MECTFALSVSQAAPQADKRTNTLKTDAAKQGKDSCRPKAFLSVSWPSASSSNGENGNYQPADRLCVCVCTSTHLMPRQTTHAYNASRAMHARVGKERYEKVVGQ